MGYNYHIIKLILTHFIKKLITIICFYFIILIRDSTKSAESNDYVMNYQQALLTINLLIRNINDAIREGDSERLINTYKIVLLYFKVTNHHKYSLSILKLPCTIENQPDRAFKLIWGL